MAVLQMSMPESSKNMTQHGGDHHGLSQLFSDPAFPSVLSFSDFLTRKRLNRQQGPSPHQWKNMFCGIPADRPPQQVCLHAEETREVEPVVSFDVDSFLGFASSLAVARQGLRHRRPGRIPSMQPLKTRKRRRGPGQPCSRMCLTAI